YGWSDQATLNRISHWLTGAAAEWYQQLVQSDELPATWGEFVKLFQARFQSPEQIEALKIERNHCMQQADESVADFYQRYKGLALEIDPKISEKTLKRHLLPKLRLDILQLMGGVDADKLPLLDLMRTAAKVELHMLQRKKGTQQRTGELVESCMAMKSSRNQEQREIYSYTTKRCSTNPESVIAAIESKTLPPTSSLEQPSFLSPANQQKSSTNNADTNKSNQQWWNRGQNNNHDSSNSQNVPRWQQRNSDQRNQSTVPTCSKCERIGITSRTKVAHIADGSDISKQFVELNKRSQKASNLPRQHTNNQHLNKQGRCAIRLLPYLQNPHVSHDLLILDHHLRRIK
ncbi:unnamed protein product, partial [Didymodactylos carnosus]